MAPRDRRRAGNLPGELNSFVDRTRELREVRRSFADQRLVTLVGVGGTGKTRLALRVAAEVRRVFRDGVWFVDLTRLPGSDGAELDALAYLVMGALGVRQAGTESTVRQLVDHLASRQVLLVLDNCEHLLPACALLVDRLLRGCPATKVLTTSRAPLAIAGEAVFGVPPLPVPDSRRRSSLAELARSGAVALLVVRANAAEPGFSLTEENVDVVADLCRRLDGLPLAIELAAAWIRALPPAQILDRLSHRFALLTRGSRAAPERQQTMRACVDWSYELCGARERLLWSRLSVFVGGFELDAVEGICADNQLGVPEVLDVVTGLLDKSILARADPDRPSGQARYRMLQTLRDYGAERLAATGERAELRRRHRDWYAGLARRAGAEWVSGRQAYWLDRLDREYPNLRAATEYSLVESGEPAAALRLLVALPPQWRFSRGVFGEELRWLDLALARVTEPVALRARALLLAAYLAGRGGELTVLSRRLEEGERLARRLADATATAFAAFVRGAAALLDNEVPAAIAALERGLAVLPAEPDPEFAPGVRLQLLTSLGVAAGLAGDHDRGRRCNLEVLTATEPVGEHVNQLTARWTLGLNSWLRGDVEDAAGQLRQALRVSAACGWDTRYAAFCVEILAWTAARQQRHRLAAVLLGAAQALRTEHDKPITSIRWMLTDHDRCERHAREALGTAAFAEAFRRGRGLSGGELVALILDEPGRPTAPGRGTPPAPAPLTRREREVAELLAEGLSNQQVASRLVISRRTAESHVAHILAKLGFTSRAQVAAWVAAEPPG